MRRCGPLVPKVEWLQMAWANQTFKNLIATAMNKNNLLAERNITYHQPSDKAAYSANKKKICLH